MNLHVLPWLLAVWDYHKEASQCSAFSGMIPNKDFLLCPFSYFSPSQFVSLQFSLQKFQGILI